MTARVGRSTGLLGACGACEATHAIVVIDDDSLVAKHGYKRRDRGYGQVEEVGECIGSRRLPHELSPVVARELARMLEQWAFNRECTIERVDRGQITRLANDYYDSRYCKPEEEWHTPERDGAYRWERRLREYREKLVREMEHLRSDARRHHQRADDWQLAPLREAKPKPAVSGRTLDVLRQVDGWGPNGRVMSRMLVWRPRARFGVVVKQGLATAVGTEPGWVLIQLTDAGRSALAAAR